MEAMAPPTGGAIGSDRRQTMKGKNIAFICIVFVILCSPVWAFDIDGDVSATGMLTDVSGNEAKFNEYRDWRDGFYGGFHLNYESDSFFLDGTALDIGYDTQHYRLEGGMWDSFRFYLDYDEIPHNYTFDAKSFYSGIGTDTLSGSPNTDLRSWSTFDYSVERKTYGGGFQLDMVKPFYILMSVSREDREGIRPTSAEGAIGFGNTVELPEPVDYRTDTLKVEAGYSRNPLFSSLSFIYSTFDNANDMLHFDNPFIDGNPHDAQALPPDNKYYKVAFKNALKLPLNSRLSMNLGFSRTKSDETLINSFLDDGEQSTISLSDPDFHGRIDTENYDLILTSNPVHFLEGKIFYKYRRRANKSDEIVMTEGSESLVNEPLSYRKNRYGIELGFRLPANLHLLTSYTHEDKFRNREDVEENNDDVYAADLTWSGLDFMEITIGYEKLNRNADYNPIDVEPNDPDFLEESVRRFDVAAKERDTYMARIDLYPMNELAIGLTYRNRDTDYDDVMLGLKGSKIDEFSIDGSYTFRDRVVISGYYYYEKIRNTQVQRNVSFRATEGFDPSTQPTDDAYNWQAKEKNKTYEYGIGADIYVIPRKLTLRLNHSSLKSNGYVDYTYFLGSNPLPSEQTQDNVDLTEWDDYRLESFLAKILYTVSKKITVSAGYVHERLSYNDPQYDGYQYVLGTPPTTYLTGAYKDLSYDADIVFINLVYNF
jgi:MtrB/PioB family decaheme-associated outer membrane protein